MNVQHWSSCSLTLDTVHHLENDLQLCSTFCMWEGCFFCNFSSELNHWFTLANWLIYLCSCCLNELSCIDIRLMLHACQLVFRLGLHWADWSLSFPSLALATVLVSTCHTFWSRVLDVWWFSSSHSVDSWTSFPWLFHMCFMQSSFFLSAVCITWCLDGWALTWYGAWSSDSTQIVAGACVSSQKVSTCVGASYFHRISPSFHQVRMCFLWNAWFSKKRPNKIVPTQTTNIAGSFFFRTLEAALPNFKLATRRGGLPEKWYVWRQNEGGNSRECFSVHLFGNFRPRRRRGPANADNGIFFSKILLIEAFLRW